MLPLAEALLKKKAKVDALDKANMTPFHLAAQRGSAAVIPALAAAAGEAGVESLAPGRTPLMLAAGSGHMEAVEALVKAGAKLGTQVGTCFQYVLPWLFRCYRRTVHDVMKGV